MPALETHEYGLTDEVCYCGAVMVEMNSCRYRCPNCGAILDCEDVSGLPK
jgi:predicted RNA-binding Zn-ribbon protein involved in translation (DUF1610 family)